MLFQSSVLVLCQVYGEGKNASFTNFSSLEQDSTNFLSSFCTGPASVYTPISLVLFYLKLPQSYFHDIYISISPSQASCDKEPEPHAGKEIGCGNRLDWEKTDRNPVLTLRQVP